MQVTDKHQEIVETELNDEQDIILKSLSNIWQPLQSRMRFY